MPSPAPFRPSHLSHLMVLFWFVANAPLFGAEPKKDAAAPKPLPPAAERKIDFERDIQPIFVSQCNSCHGEDAQEGRLRLDAPRIVERGGISGPLYVSGKSAESLLIHRVMGHGDEPQMPLDADPLSDVEIGLLRAWIDQGAVWPKGVGSDVESLETHWAYIKPVRPAVPDVEQRDWVQNPVDAFILARLETAGLRPSPEADPERLLRRVSLDLIGLPPTIAELEQFLNDKAPGAYERAVDRLLASPRYGERWALPWLDAARYADSNGYQRDGEREVWAYRDYVIRSLNDDLPFDRFTIEQIAGDLLPNPTHSQVVATGFHRGTMANVEAGTDPEEEHVLAVIDRVNTTGTVWLGTTIECTQCHNHKYDPFTQKDFYRLYAFFNNTEKEIEATGTTREFVGPKFSLPLPDEMQGQRRQLQEQMQAVGGRINQLTSELLTKLPDWEEQFSQTAQSASETTWIPLPVEAFSSNAADGLKQLEDGSLLARGKAPPTDTYQVRVKTDLQGIQAFRLETLSDPSLPDGGPGRAKPGNFILSEFRVEAAEASEPEKFSPIELTAATADFSQAQWPVAHAIDGKPKTGWGIGPQFAQSHFADFATKLPAGFAGGTILRFTLDQQYGGAKTIGRFRLFATTTSPADASVPGSIQTILALAPEKRSRKQHDELAKYYLSQSSELQKMYSEQTGLQTKLSDLQPPTSLVMRELDQPRMTTVFKRGDFLKPGESVKAGTPAMLHPLPEDPQPNRLTLAKWLVDVENPLAGRVTVNRHWAEFFGQGLVETVEDFGTQSEPPTHPELLDWLATEFVDSGWSVKNLHRLLVTSAAYRQSSRVTPALLRRDLYNKLYARGPRFRLRAELVRDNALAVAGLLSGKFYGPPVFPYQPDGIWNHIGRASNDWRTSSGEDQHRRGLYVYWRRTVPYPSFVSFDAPSREACTVKRSRSNTPLQALTLMNDPVYLEAAARFAERVLRELPESATIEDRVAHAFRLAASRSPSFTEIDILAARYEEELDRYRNDETAARKLTAAWKPADGIETAEFAAWLHVTGVILNLDEVISR